MKTAIYFLDASSVPEEEALLRAAGELSRSRQGKGRQSFAFRKTGFYLWAQDCFWTGDCKGMVFERET